MEKDGKDGYLSIPPDCYREKGWRLRRRGYCPSDDGANIETTPISMDLKEASNILNAATHHIITIR